MSSDFTVALIKPDGVEKALIGPILSIAGQQDLVPVDLRFVTFDDFLVEAFYFEHLGKAFFRAHAEFMKSGPSLAILFRVTSDKDAVSTWRDLMGATDPAEARKSEIQTIRKQWGHKLPRNVVHGSDSEGRVVLETRLLGLGKR